MSARKGIPFMIFGLPRSRTAWLAKFLTYGSWICYHDKATKLRSIDEMESWLSRPRVGFCEIEAAPARHLIWHFQPKIRVVVIRRPVEESIRATMRAALAVGMSYDLDKLTKSIKYSNRCLDRIARIPCVKVFQYRELSEERVCREIFEFCLPYKFDRSWWLLLRDWNIQIDMRIFFTWYLANRDGIENFKRLCKLKLIALRRSGELRLAVHGGFDAGY